MAIEESDATVQSIWDDGMEEIPPDVLDDMAYQGRIWVLREPIRFPFASSPSQAYTYSSSVLKQATYRAVDSGDRRHFIIEGTFDEAKGWEKVGHIVK